MDGHRCKQWEKDPEWRIRKERSIYWSASFHMKNVDCTAASACYRSSLLVVKRITRMASRVSDTHIEASWGNARLRRAAGWVKCGCDRSNTRLGLGGVEGGAWLLKRSDDFRFGDWCAAVLASAAHSSHLFLSGATSSKALPSSHTVLPHHRRTRLICAPLA